MYRQYYKCGDSCDYLEFYKQAGAGLDISVYKGIPFQRGKGIFGNLLQRAKRYAIPFLKYIGSKALTTGKDIIKDLSEGSHIKDATKKNLKRTASNILRDVSTKIDQSGEGMKRKRTQKSKPKTKKKVIKRKTDLKTRKKRRNRKSKKDFKLNNFDIFKP